MVIKLTSAICEKSFKVLFKQAAPSASLLLSVVLPIRNEANNLVRALDALRNQLDENNLPFQSNKYEVLLLANNCTDQSFEIAKAYQKLHPLFALHITEIYLPNKSAHIGTARRLLMDEAYSRFMLLEKHKGIIASTDGDTEVDPKWIYHIVQEIQKGNDAVGGRITVNELDDKPGAYHSFSDTYRTLIARAESILDPVAHDPWPSHFQYFGASLAVTCDVYHAVGRLPQLPYLEDEAFYKALYRHDAKIRRSPFIKVSTSGRHEGRVSIGMSEQLKKWAQMEAVFEPQMVAGAVEIIARLKNRQNLRLCWAAAKNAGKCDPVLFKSVASSLLIPLKFLREHFKSSRYFGQLWETLENEMQANGWNKKWKPVSITEAITDLEAFILLYQECA